MLEWQAGQGIFSCAPPGLTRQVAVLHAGTRFAKSAVRWADPHETAVLRQGEEADTQLGWSDQFPRLDNAFAREGRLRVPAPLQPPASS